METRTRRTFLKAGMAAGAAIAGPLAAQGPGTKPLTIVFPYGAGGAVDTMIRTLGEYLAAELNRPVIVDNRPGANSVIGAEYVAKARPDGDTLLWAAWPTLTTNLTLYPNLRFSLKDFEPITSTFQGYTSVSVGNGIPATNFRELVDHAKRNAGRLAYGALGVGSSPHLLMELGGQVSGVKFELVNYKGEVQGIADLIGGHLPAYAGAMANQVEHHRAKRLRMVAVSSAERLEALPDVPTFKEAGYDELVFSYWHGVLAPAGTPRAVIDALNRVIVVGMERPAVKARMAIDQRVMTSTPEAFRERIVSDTRRWGELIRQRGIRLDA